MDRYTRGLVGFLAGVVFSVVTFLVIYEVAILAFSATD